MLYLLIHIVLSMHIVLSISLEKVYIMFPLCILLPIFKCNIVLDIPRRGIIHTHVRRHIRGRELDRYCQGIDR